MVAAESGRSCTKPPAMNGALATNGLKHTRFAQIRRATRLPIFQAAALTRPVRGPFNFPAVNANQGLPSRDILAHKSAARPSLGGAQLRSADPRPDGGACG